MFHVPNMQDQRTLLPPHNHNKPFHSSNKLIYIPPSSSISVLFYPNHFCRYQFYLWWSYTCYFLSCTCSFVNKCRRCSCRPWAQTENISIGFILSRYACNLNREHWTSLKRVFRYLRRTIEYYLTYTGYPDAIKWYSDANGVTGSESIKSTTELLFILDGAAISWKSCK